MEEWNIDKKEYKKQILSFDEIEKGYTQEEAIQEAKRCLYCKHKPCMRHCPASVAIPEFIDKIVHKEWEKAYQIIRQSNCLPEVCGRVCPQEKQCEGNCVRGIKGKPIAIGKLERFVADQHLFFSSLPSFHPSLSIPKMGKVGIIGSGPASLGCAQALLDLGYQVTIWEKMDTIGGILRYGIPNYRLPKKLLDQRILRLKKQGVLFQTGVYIGKDISLEKLKQEYHALFLGCGACVANKLYLSNENIYGIQDAHTFLKICNLDDDYTQERLSLATKKHIVIIGGGNVAMDVARCAKRVTSGNVSIVYRRSMEELPARKEEIECAIHEGISFCLLTNPLKAISDSNGNLQSLQCVKMELTEPDESGRRKPQVIEGSHFVIPTDYVVVAIGSSLSSLWKEQDLSLKINEKGWIATDEHLQTSIPGVFAGGDAVTSPKTVVEAMCSGIQAAHQIDNYIRKLKNRDCFYEK